MPTPWITEYSDGSEKVRLFCLPFAGGNSQIYRNWPDHLPAGVGVLAVELPGRGARMREPPISDMAALIAALSEALVPYLDRPFAFFGHSMGAAIAYEAARHVTAADGRSAAHLFVSARRAPGMKSRRPAADTLDDGLFIQRLRELGGTSEAVLAEPDLMALFLPMLRADFRLNDTYQPLPGPALACPLTVFGGQGDPEALVHELEAWRGLAPVGFELCLFPGDHYFFQSVRPDLLARIAREL
jgi:surfactin synthase thioesterase subunit